MVMVIAGWPVYLPERGMEWPPIVLRLSALTSNPWSVVIMLCQTKYDPICWSWWRSFLWIFRWKTQPENIQVKDPDLKVTVLSNEGGGRLSFSCPKVAPLTCVWCLFLCVPTSEKFDLHFLISWLGLGAKKCFFSGQFFSVFLNSYLHGFSILICRACKFLFAGLLNDRRVDDLVPNKQHVELSSAKVVIKS